MASTQPSPRSDAAKKGWETRRAKEPASKEKELRSWFTEFANQMRVFGTYDAARSGNDLDRYWVNADSFSADSANSRDVRQTLVKRSRYEAANNGISDGIAQTYCTDLVGVGPQLRMQTLNTNFNQMVEREFYLWSRAIQLRRKLWCMAHAKHVDGEALAVMRVNKKVAHPVQLDLVLHETEQCQTPFPPITDPRYIDGIKFDEFDNALWYDFLVQHPGQINGILTAGLDAERVPAERVLHWFKLRRPGQHRGVPECSSTLNIGAAFRRLREANLSTAEKVAAWTLLLKTMFEPEVLQGTPALSTLEIFHGMMTALPNTMEPVQLKAEHPGPTYDTFYKTLANEQGRPKSMPLNKILCNSADYNYSSGRLDHQTYYSALDVDREDGDDLVLNPLFDLWFTLAISAFQWLGGAPSAVGPAARVHLFDWPKHRVADVEAEANANETKLKSGQIFPHRLFSDMGLDWEDEIMAAALKYGITPEQMKKRVLDTLMPEAKQPLDKGENEPVEAWMKRLYMLGLDPRPSNGNGKHG